MSYKNYSVLDTIDLGGVHKSASGNPRVVFGDYVMIYNSSTTNLELYTTTTSAKNNVNVFCWAGYNFGLINTSAENVVISNTGTTQIVGDPGIIAGGENRIYDITPVDPNDKVWWRVFVNIHNSGAATSCRFSVQNLASDAPKIDPVFGSGGKLNTQTIKPNVWTPIVFDTVLAARNMTLSLTDNPFRIDKYGCYTINANVIHDDNTIIGGTYVESRLTKNGQPLSLAHGFDLQSDRRCQTNHSFMTDLVQSDIIGIEVRHSNANNNRALVEMSVIANQTWCN